MSATARTEQPLPASNGRPSIQDLVRVDLDTREQVGIQRYGTSLQPFNSRDALRDAYEEAIDLTLYLRQVIEEDHLLRAALARLAQAAEQLQQGWSESLNDVNDERWQALGDRTYEAWDLLRSGGGQ